MCGSGGAGWCGGGGCDDGGHLIQGCYGIKVGVDNRSLAREINTSKVQSDEYLCSCQLILVPSSPFSPLFPPPSLSPSPSSLFSPLSPPSSLPLSSSLPPLLHQMITLGGDAELELVDSLDPFSEGIVFSVRPPKKSWKNISNLSGGEKTLSSLALVSCSYYGGLFT